jgi:hypothetical protein
MIDSTYIKAHEAVTMTLAAQKGAEQQIALQLTSTGYWL